MTVNEAIEKLSNLSAAHRELTLAYDTEEGPAEVESIEIHEDCEFYLGKPEPGVLLR